MTDINLNSPNKGLLSDAMTDVPVDSAASARTSAPEGLTVAEEEELRSELAKVTGRSPLSAAGTCVPLGRNGREPQEQDLGFLWFFGFFFF